MKDKILPLTFKLHVINLLELMTNENISQYTMDTQEIYVENGQPLCSLMRGFIRLWEISPPGVHVSKNVRWLMNT